MIRHLRRYACGNWHRVFKDAKEAVSTCVRLARRITPSMENHQKYQRHFRIHKELHDNLTSTYRELSRILAGEEK